MGVRNEAWQMFSEPNKVHQVTPGPVLRQQCGRTKPNLATREEAEAAEPVLSSLWPPGREWSHHHPPTEPSGHYPIISILQKGRAIHLTRMGQVLWISSLTLLITDSPFSLLWGEGDIQLGLERWDNLKCQRKPLIGPGEADI